MSVLCLRTNTSCIVVLLNGQRYMNFYYKCKYWWYEINIKVKIERMVYGFLSTSIIWNRRRRDEHEISLLHSMWYCVNAIPWKFIGSKKRAFCLTDRVSTATSCDVVMKGVVANFESATCHIVLNDMFLVLGKTNSEKSQPSKPLQLAFRIDR